MNDRLSYSSKKDLDINLVYLLLTKCQIWLENIIIKNSKGYQNNQIIKTLKYKLKYIKIIQNRKTIR